MPTPVIPEHPTPLPGEPCKWGDCNFVPLPTPTYPTTPPTIPEIPTPISSSYSNVRTQEVRPTIDWSTRARGAYEPQANSSSYNTSSRNTNYRSSNYSTTSKRSSCDTYSRKQSRSTKNFKLQWIR